MDFYVIHELYTNEWKSILLVSDEWDETDDIDVDIDFDFNFDVDFDGDFD